MLAKTVKIYPTNQKGSEGYKEAIITCFDDQNKPIKSWPIDSFKINGRYVHVDFEAENGGIQMWAPNGHSLDVVECYGPIITATF